MIFQYPVIALCVSVVTCITQAAGVYCQFESKFYFAKLWVRASWLDDMLFECSLAY